MKVIFKNKFVEILLINAFLIFLFLCVKSYSFAQTETSEPPTIISFIPKQCSFPFVEGDITLHNFEIYPMFPELFLTKYPSKEPTVIFCRFWFYNKSSFEFCFNKTHQIIFTSGIGIINLPPFLRYSACCSIISSAKFHAKSNT